MFFHPILLFFKLQIMCHCSKFLKNPKIFFFSAIFLRLKWKYILRPTPYRNKWFSLLTLHSQTGRKYFHKLKWLMHSKVIWNLPSINNVLLSIVWRCLNTGKQVGCSLIHLGEINWHIPFYLVLKNETCENSNIWMYLAR